MKTVTINVFLALLTMGTVMAQELRPLAELVQTARQQGTAFQTASNVFSEVSGANKSAAARALDPQDLTVVQYDYNALPESQTLQINVPSPDGLLSLEVVEMPETYMDFRAMTHDGVEVVPDDARYFRGIIQGDPYSLVALTFFEDRVMGMASNAQGNYVIGKDPNSSLMMVYNDWKLKETPQFVCDYIEPEEDIPYTPEELQEPNRQSAGNCVNMHFTTEYDMFTELGSSNAVDNFVRGFFHQVAIVYFNDGIDVNLSALTIWTSNDPFTATNTASLLDQYENNTGNFNGNLSQLLTFRNVGGGRANTDKLCNFFPDNRKSVSGIDNDFEGVPLYSWTVNVVAHEFGHTIGSRHTHDCVWTWLGSSGQAIDHCGSYYGFLIGEDYGGQGCLDTNNPRLPNPGTVMSYCHLITSINFSNGFQGQVANLLNNKVDNASCLTNCNYQCPDLCDIDAQITSISWSTTRGDCKYKFIAKNPENPMCMSSYDYEWTIQGVLGVVSTSQEFIYDFSNFANGTYNVNLEISYNGVCLDTAVYSRTINCGINSNPSCPSASGLYIGEAEPCIDYMISYPYASGVSQIVWKYNIHGVAGEQTIMTTTGPGPYSVPFSLPTGHNYDNHYLWVHADITLTNGNTCRRSNSKLLTCPGGGGGGGSRVLLTPNPTTGAFSIENQTEWEISKVMIKDIYGNTVAVYHSAFEVPMYLSRQMAGLYFVEVTMNEGPTIIKKLILEQ